MVKNPYAKRYRPRRPRYWFEDSAFLSYLSQYPGRNGSYRSVFKTPAKRNYWYDFWKKNGFIPYYSNCLTKAQVAKLWKRP